MIKVFEYLRDFLTAIFNTLIALFKVIIFSKFKTVFPKRNGTEIAFLANGPSLNDALSKMKSEQLPNNIMVTNFFCKSEYFKELKPNYYTISDPLFNYNGYKNDYRIPEFYSLLFSTDWEITILIPHFLKKDIKRIVREGKYENNNIKISYFNSVNFNGKNSLLLQLMKYKLGIPRPTTVAVPAIFNCMHMGFKKIKIAGIDLNQHLDITVGGDNILKLKEKHFYNNQVIVKSKPWLKPNNQVYKTSEIFLVFHYFFYSFDVLAKYAEKYNIEILNYSSDSYLDQFKKV